MQSNLTNPIASNSLSKCEVPVFKVRHQGEMAPNKGDSRCAMECSRKRDLKLVIFESDLH